MSLPPIWGEKAKWVGELGSVVHGLTSLEDRMGVLGISLENTLLPETNYFPTSTYERRKTKKCGDGFRNRNKSNNCFLQYFFFYSCSCFFFFLLFSSTSSKHWSLNLLLHPTQLRFLDLRSWTPCGILHEWYKKINNNNTSNNENLLYVGGIFLGLFCCGL